MSKFLKRLAQFFFLPVLLLLVILGLYIKQDIFRDFGTYKNYSWKYVYQRLGDVSTKKLLHSTEPYNSFIMGSSRTTSLYACYLQTKIKNSRFFHYANWNESIGGIYAKLRLIDSLGYHVDNLFIYMDTDATFVDDGRCINDHYLLTGQNKWDYYLKHYLVFVPPPFEAERYEILLGKHPAALCPDWESDRVTNDSRHTCSDSVINNYGNSGFDSTYNHLIDSLIKTGFLYARPKTVTFKEKQISPGEEAMLNKVAALLHKHHTKYYIVITPLYDQLKFNPTDMQILKRVFQNNIYDFSGINSITNNPYNYADRKHFAPYISKLMVDSILNNVQKKATFKL